MLTAPVAMRERAWHLALDRRVVLAVSGGADSMMLATLAVARHRAQVAAIATFDHGTGAAAREAAALVVRWAHEHDVPVHAGRAAGPLPRTEAAWRAARWAFLRQVAAALEAPVVTAHTEDDQVETVFMRLLRGSGIRGLAGLRAAGPVGRPLLHVTRTALRASATEAGVPFVDDPANADLRYLRNRVRLEILPALERAQPGFRSWVLSIGERAAAWRRDVAAAVDRDWAPVVDAEGRCVSVPRDPRRIPCRDEAALFWPEVAGRIGVALDRRGTARLASFTTHRRTGQQVPLSGGVTVTSGRREWSMERARARGTDVTPSDRRAPPRG